MIKNISNLGDAALYCDFGNIVNKETNTEVIRYFQNIKNSNIDGINNLTPSYNKLIISFDLAITNFSKLKKIIENLSINKKIIGIGETGLDFYYNHSEKKDQIRSFEEHIQASIELNIPLIIHSRNAENETLEIFNKYKNDKLKILMHCFTGSKKFAENLLNLGAYFSASGIITFKNSQELQNTFKFIPLDKILIETDSPYLAPVPNRGKQNEPSFVIHTAQKLADIKQISNFDLIKNTTSNFNTLFN